MFSFLASRASCTTLSSSFLLSHVPRAYRSKYITNHRKKKPPQEPMTRKVEPKPKVPLEPVEPERRRKSTVERRKERYGERPTSPTTSPKDKTKYAQRMILKKQSMHAKAEENPDTEEEQEQEQKVRLYTERNKSTHIEPTTKNKGQLIPPSTSKFYPRRGYSYGDRMVLHVKAGNGGSGAVSFATGKYIRIAPADGGSGGRGGDVIIKANYGMQEITLDRRQFAKNGQGGQGGGSAGKNGEDLILNVPVGTIVRELHKEVTQTEDGQEYEEWVRGDIIVDIGSKDDRVVIAKGGRGGKGNFSFTSSANRSPKTKELGQIGEEKVLELELKTMADVGFVGYPNAGKSTLLSKLSNAMPKIMPYPFTTKSPNVGIMEISEFKRITLADLPGIIEGANEDRGLGIEFLRHIERTKVLCFVIDMAGTERKFPWRDYFTLREEVGQYNKSLLWRPAIILANKMDLPDAHGNLVVFKEKVKAKAKLERRLVPPIFPVTAKTGMDLEPVIRALSRMVPDPIFPVPRPSVFGDSDEDSKVTGKKKAKD